MNFNNFIFLLVFCLVSCIEVPSFHHQIGQLKRTITTPTMYLECRGLLVNVDVKTADFFTSDLDLTKSDKLLNDKIYVLMESADKKADETLQHILQKADAFMESNQLWNRDELTSALKSIIYSKGIFACVLGGKNTGKSLVLEEMERLEDKVFLVDLRRNSDILGSLIEKLRERRLRYKSTQFSNAIMKVVAGLVYKATDDKLKDILSLTDYQMVLDALIKTPAALASVLDDISSGYGGVTLIIDEANIALTINEFTTAAEIKATREALAIFTRLTKQKQKVSYF